jgi:hydroxylaminobenzene mutase
MDVFERRLCFAGLALFVFGLAIGFVLKVFPNPRAALSAHLNAVQSGTFLMVLGLLWPKLAVWKSIATPLSHVVWISFLVVEVGMVLMALAPPAAEGQAPTGLIRLGSAALMGLSTIAMLVSVGALLATFRPVAPLPGEAAGQPPGIGNR